MHITRRRILTGTALAATAGLGACALSPAEPAAEAQPTGRFVEVEGLRLHYRTLGSGPRAVALHGASGNLLDWTTGPGQAIAETNELLLLDRPGLGFSDPAPAENWNPFVQARLLAGAARALGFGLAHLIGHSYGGSVALAWAVERPETLTGLLLLAAPSQVWKGGVGTLNDLAANPLTGPLISRLAPRIAGDGTIASAVERIFAPQDPPPDYAARIDARLALRPAQIRRNAQDLTRLKGHIARMVPRYPALPMPVELIHGTADTIVPAHIHSDLTAAQIPDATYTRLEGIGHMPHHAAPGALRAALARLNAAL